MSLTNFLEEKYNPITRLVKSENNRRKLMSLGVTDKSTLKSISLEDAETNDRDLILFMNLSPTDDEPGTVAPSEIPNYDEGKRYNARAYVMYNGYIYKSTKPVPPEEVPSSYNDEYWVRTSQMPKGREKFKEQKAPSIWIGYKKGNDFEVFRPKEAATNMKKGTKCEKNIDCLYKTDLAYVVVNPKDVELRRQFRERTPWRAGYIEKRGDLEVRPEDIGAKKDPHGFEEGEPSKVRVRLLKVRVLNDIEKVIDKMNKDAIEEFKELEKDIKNNNYGSTDGRINVLMYPNNTSDGVFFVELLDKMKGKEVTSDLYKEYIRDIKDREEKFKQ